ncbi:MAG TPA: metal-dependent transcriptional regulator [Aggregatilineales bacterium]|nr:metal-dependent transcriptional regulator [Aggregatilineales bacterium]
MQASAVQQEYLAEAYRLLHYQPFDEPYVTTSALAEQVGVSAPAVAAVVERLKRGGFVEHEPYRGIKLTPKGIHEALMSIRRHRLTEVFLVKVMGFGWHEVHDEADRIGAAVSDVVAARMEHMAGYPRRCPHGEPIPSADGVMPDVVDTPLAEVLPPAEVTISRVHTHDAEVLKYLAELGLVPEQAIRLVRRAPFNGPLTLRIGKQEQVIGSELARVLRVSLT